MPLAAQHTAGVPHETSSPGTDSGHIGEQPPPLLMLSPHQQAKPLPYYQGSISPRFENPDDGTSMRLYLRPAVACRETKPDAATLGLCHDAKPTAATALGMQFDADDAVSFSSDDTGTVRRFADCSVCLLTFFDKATLNAQKKKKKRKKNKTKRGPPSLEK